MDSNVRGTGIGTRIHLWGCNGKNSNQHLVFENERIRVLGTNRCFDIAAGNIKKDKLITYTCHDGSNQKWSFDDKGRIHSVMDDSYCIDLPNIKLKNGTKL